MNKYIQEMNTLERQRLINMGIIIEDNQGDDNWEASPEEISDIQGNAETQLDSNFPNANYELQNEIIRFFVNNPGADPELFRQYAASLGVEPEELHHQENILLSQLLKIYTADSEELGYGDALTTDDPLSDEIQRLVTPGA